MTQCNKKLLLIFLLPTIKLSDLTGNRIDVHVVMCINVHTLVYRFFFDCMATPTCVSLTRKLRFLLFVPVYKMKKCNSVLSD